ARQRQAQNAPEADELETWVFENLKIAVCHHLTDAAPGNEEHERSDDGLDAKAGDEPAVEQAEKAGHQDRNDEGERNAQRRIAGAEGAQKDEDRKSVV